MAKYKADNAAVRESLAQVQGEMNLFWGNMETILELLQSQRNPASAGTTVDPPAETVVPNSGNRQVVPTDTARLAAPYPWGMPPHLAASLTSGELSSLTWLLLLLLETLAGAPQAPNAQPGMQYFQPATAAQIVPPGFSYSPMWFNPNMPTPIAPEASRPASQVASPVVDPAKPADYQLSDGRIRVIEGFSSFGIDARDLCLVPNVVLPQKFKVPDLAKYKGLSCPRSHLTMYCRKMASHIDNDNLLIHWFQDSLIGASLDWYMSLERSKIRSWRDLSEAILKQYKYNLGMAPTRLQLQNQS
ncbi:uncharacterized protein LOC127103839 [Lathyrus oleraceus]|uniref:uncharacterized protein LOC127103839 n=1 Tax=Pisum sativum TaxID=3888 RepID=UPI0021CFBC9A|nr:uncharacterized protein LOC127103839 [Pisum sativum]